MSPFSVARRVTILPLLFLAIGVNLSQDLQAEDVLFFGNSFTSANNIPKMVETIAGSKGKVASTIAVTKGGQGWAYHLAKPATDPALQSKSWNWIVLQDYSLNATHGRKVEDFFKTGEGLYERVAKLSPQANILLYQTWAYSPEHPVFKGDGEEKVHFASPGEMEGEIQKNYAALQTRLQAKDPQRTVLIAPVGAAFARCVREHPEISIYGTDFKHPSMEGSYLSAAVIYAVLFKDSPLGAAPAKKVDPQEAKLLQQVAADTVHASRGADK